MGITVFRTVPSAFRKIVLFAFSESTRTVLPGQSLQTPSVKTELEFIRVIPLGGYGACSLQPTPLDTCVPYVGILPQRRYSFVSFWVSKSVFDLSLDRKLCLLHLSFSALLSCFLLHMKMNCFEGCSRYWLMPWCEALWASLEILKTYMNQRVIFNVTSTSSTVHHIIMRPSGMFFSENFQSRHALKTINPEIAKKFIKWSWKI